MLLHKQRVFFALFLTLFLWAGLAMAQGHRQTVYFSGIVISKESTDGMPGVHIYIPKAGKGTTTNANGFFLLPTLSEDSVVITAVGYKTQHYIIPKDKQTGFSALINLQQDTTMLAIVEVYPYPTKELFKEAFLSLRLEDDKQIDYARKNLDKALLEQMLIAMPVDGSTSYKYYIQQSNANLYNRGFYPTFQFLNPFAWIEAINAIKRNSSKNKK